MSTPLRMLGESHKLCFLNLEHDSNASIHHLAVDNRLDGAHDDHTKSKTTSVITTNATRLSMWVTLSIIIGYKDPFGGLAQGVHKEQQAFGQ